MEIYAKPDKTYTCSHCECEMWYLDDGIAVYIDLGYGLTYTVCVTCANNMTEDYR